MVRVTTNKINGKKKKSFKKIMSYKLYIWMYKFGTTEVLYNVLLYLK